jgi:hypothetical protein
MECFAHPSQEESLSGLVGTTSATGRPNRVTRTGAPVRRTSSRTAKHVALNLEIAISRIFNLYHSPIPWSECHMDVSARRRSAAGLKLPGNGHLGIVAVPSRVAFQAACAPAYFVPASHGTL